MPTCRACSNANGQAATPCRLKISLVYDNYHQMLPALAPDGSPKPEDTHEATPGAYAQYTYNLDDRLIAMVSMRVDRSSLYGKMFTPRVHIRYNVVAPLTLQLSASTAAIARPMSWPNTTTCWRRHAHST